MSIHQNVYVSAFAGGGTENECTVASVIGFHRGVEMRNEIKWNIGGIIFLEKINFTCQSASNTIGNRCSVYSAHRIFSYGCEYTLLIKYV